VAPWIRLGAAAMLALATCPARAEAPDPVAAGHPAPAFVPAGFDPPTRAEGKGFQLVSLGPALVRIDYDAYMSSIEHLQTTFSRSPQWPHAGITDAEAMLDMETEQGRFQRRESFAYGVLTPDGSRERGSFYLSPSPVPGFQAVARLWVTKAEYDAGFDRELYRWARHWVKTAWPFARVAWPGRAIPWARWDAMVTAAKAP